MKYLGKYKQYTKQAAMVLAAPTDAFYFKVTNNYFHFAPSFIDFFTNYASFISSGKSDEVYELLPFSGKLPLYFDIEWESYEIEDITPLQSFLDLFSLYCEKRHKFSTIDFAMTCATRDKEVFNKRCVKHSYHLIMRQPAIHFKNQLDMRNFVTDFRNWVFNLDDNRTVDLNISRITDSNSDAIPDMSVYCKNPSTFKALRMVCSHKGKENSKLRVLGDKSLENYFVQYVANNSREFIPIEVCELTEKAKIKRDTQSRIYLPSPSQPIPPNIINYATSLIKNYHPSATYIGYEVTHAGQDYRLLFNDYSSRCLSCGKIHTQRKNNYHTHAIHYLVGLNKYIYTCRTEGSKPLSLAKPIGIIRNWDYQYDDTNEINFKPLSIDHIGVGGTFLGQSAKGTGKSEAIVKFVASLPKEASVLYPSFRINLCSKNYAELRDYGFSYYKDSDFNPHRAIICLNSLTKIKKKTPYDVVIIDEIYSVLECFSSPLLRDKKLLVCMYFEKLISEAKRVYCLDAHLDCSLVVKPLHSLRDPEKFVYHKNPRAHDYSDYKVYYDEYGRKEDKSFVTLESRILSDIAIGKKVAVMCSSKAISERIALIIKDTHPKVGVKLYNSDTDGVQKRDDFEDTLKSWGSGEVKAIVYSPSVSAGISYNDVSINGVHKLYCFISGGKNLPSFNTTRQMFFRVRQLLDKEIHILLYNKLQPYEGEAAMIENNLRNKFNEYVNSTIDPFLKVVGLDDEFKPIFDTTSWSYKLWLETKKELYNYDSVSKIKEAIKNEFYNKPDNPIYAGRGCQFIDKSSQEAIQVQLENRWDEIQAFREQTELTNYILQDPLTENEFTRLADRLKEGKDPLTELETFKYKRHLKLRYFDIDNQKLYLNRLSSISHPPQLIRNEELDEILTYIINSEPGDAVAYRNQKRFLNSYDLQSFSFQNQVSILRYTQTPYSTGELTDYLKEGLRSDFDKKIAQPLLLEDLFKQNGYRLGKILELLVYIDIELFSDLTDKKITREALKDIIGREDFTSKIQPIVDSVMGKFKDESKYVKANRILQRFYNDEPEGNWWDSDREAMRRRYNFYDKFKEFNEKTWANNQKKVDKDKFREEVLLNKWCPTAWRKYRADCYKEDDLRRLINLSVGYLGYELAKDEKEIKSHRAASSYVFINKYSLLKELQRDGVVIDDLEKLERVDRDFGTWTEKPVELTDDSLLDSGIVKKN